MAALLVAMSVMALASGAAAGVWQTTLRREREAELIFRGEQYVRAIALFQRRYAGAFPPSVDALVDQRFLRRRYRDPMTNRDFRVLYAGAGPALVSVRTRVAASRSTAGGVIGVVSTSDQVSIRQYKGRQRYDEWLFVTDGGPGVRAPAPAPAGRRR